MTVRDVRSLFGFPLLAGALLVVAPRPHAQAPAAGGIEPVRRTITVNGAEREYFIRMPKAADPSGESWLVMAAHGAGGNGRTFFLASGMRRYADEQSFNAVIVSPTYSATDGAAQQFPSLGEGAFFDAVVADVKTQHRIRPKLLVTGYSRGGQFSHRYCQDHPDRVLACAPFAAGSWTTPDGRVIVQGVGELATADAAKARTEPLATDLAAPRIAPVAWKRAAAGAKGVPFLVMTGTLDPAYQAGRLFAENLRHNGFSVETVWPVTNHTSTPETRAEFERYAVEAVRFFGNAVARAR
jgi:poly(3-hydroxybutyrate) depolymerase